MPNLFSLQKSVLVIRQILYGCLKNPPSSPDYCQMDLALNFIVILDSTIYYHYLGKTIR